MYCVCNQVYNISYHVHQEPRLGVLHLPAGVLNLPSRVCISYHVNQEPHLVYCICQQVYCICHHVHQEPHLGVLHMPSCKSGATLGCTTVAIKCTAKASLYFRSLTWVYWICHQVYCIYYHVNQEPWYHTWYTVFVTQVYCIWYHVHQEPHLGVLHLPLGVLHMPSSNIRSNTGVYYISHQVHCRGHAVLQELHLGVLHFPSSVL